MNKVAIVVPIYKTELNEHELIALQQVKKVLNKYPLLAMVPESFQLGKVDYFDYIEHFADTYFTSISAYNRLMLSPDFYRRFQQYEYILIYQLDAFVFEDKLSYFCDLGYDYIGAPWLHGLFNYVDKEHCVWHVGNGGLSLRKVSSFIELLEERNPLLDEQIKNEDLFFSCIISDRFRVAPLDVALQFAFERQVEQCFERNHRELPFGCHAWERYNLGFWKPYIEKCGYYLDDSFGSGEDQKREQEYQLYEILAEVMKQRSMVDRVKDKLVDLSARSIVVFGAGFYGKGVVRCLVDQELRVMGFCDNNQELIGTTLQGYPVYSVNDLKLDVENVCVVIANYEHEDAMAKQLEQIGFVRKKEYFTFTDFVELLTQG